MRARNKRKKTEWMDERKRRKKNRNKRETQ